MKRIFLGLMTFAAIAIFISSCTLGTTTNTTPGSAVLFSNASPSSVPFDLYIDGVPFFTDLAYTNYTPNYNVIAPGAHTFTYVPLGTTTPILLSASVSLASNIEYSFFTEDSIDTITQVLPSNAYALTIDNTIVPPLDSSKVRFMHFSPMDSTVDFSIPNIITDTARTPNDAQTNMALDSFKTIISGTYKINVFLHNTVDTLVTSTQTFTGGKVYTIVLSGITSEPTTPLKLALYTVIHN